MSASEDYYRYIQRAQIGRECLVTVRYGYKTNNESNTMVKRSRQSDNTNVRHNWCEIRCPPFNIKIVVGNYT